METSGLGLDYQKMDADQWTLYFKSGSWLYNNQMATLEPAIMPLKPEQFDELEIYNVYFSRLRNDYYILPDSVDAPCASDLYLGGFLINGCELRYFYPPGLTCDEDGEVYVKAFTTAFGKGYLPIGTTDKCGDICQPFNNDFSADFQFDCELLATRCETSIGGSDGTQFLIDGYVKIPCITNLA